MNYAEAVTAAAQAYQEWLTLARLHGDERNGAVRAALRRLTEALDRLEPLQAEQDALDAAAAEQATGDVGTA
jgi:hypothetical protein